uniref:Uncharacterized protein n=1 Tax=Pristionchus pacificus TaxID=54126 RepID=A0A2A6BNM4_PRIPA|eukprot:PDM67383.1 hypothetical protein PRIPAC_48800 [Pristionchus pacificus]
MTPKKIANNSQTSCSVRPQSGMVDTIRMMQSRWPLQQKHAIMREKQQRNGGENELCYYYAK